MRPLILPFGGVGSTLSRFPVPFTVFAIMVLIGLPSTILFAEAVEQAAAGYPDAEVLELQWTSDFDGELRREQKETFAAMEWTTALAMLMALVASVFFGGGFAVLFGEERNVSSLQAFFSGGARFFLRSLRVTLLLLILLVLLNRLLFGQDTLEFALQSVYGVRSFAELPTDRDVFLVDGARGLAFLLVTGYLVFLARLARVILVVDTRETTVDGDPRERQSAVLAFLSAFFFTVRHPIRTVAFAIGYLLLFAIVFGGAYFLITSLEKELTLESEWLLWVLGASALLVAFLQHGILRGACYAGMTELYFEALESEVGED